MLNNSFWMIFQKIKIVYVGSSGKMKNVKLVYMFWIVF